MPLLATELTWHTLFETVEGLVAVGTISLALVTGALALATFRMARRTRDLAGSTDQEVRAVVEQVELSRRTVESLQHQIAVAQEQAAAMAQQVEVARDEAEIARTALQAAAKPVLVDVPRRFDDSDVLVSIIHEVAYEGEGAVRVSVPLRNAGTGIAFIRAASMRFRRPVPGDGTLSVTVVAPGDSTTFYFSVRAALWEEFESYGTFSVELSYTDVRGEQWTLTRADVHRGGDDKQWAVRQIFLYELVEIREGGSFDGGEPVASSGAAGVF